MGVCIDCVQQGKDGRHPYQECPIWAARMILNQGKGGHLTGGEEGRGSGPVTVV